MITRDQVKDALKPIAQGLFGKQGTARYERPHFPLRPLETMLRDLTEIPFGDWYRYAFSREPLNGKFQDDQRRKWMEQSVSCGYEYADRIRSQYGCETPEELARAFGMQVTYPSFPEKTDRVLFAEFREPDQIRIYMDAADRVRRYQNRPQIREVLTGELNITSLLLAHELFHYVEETYRKEIFTRTEKVRLWSLGPLHNDSGIMILGEIAAMAFAQKLTGIPYAPYVMDVFLVYGYSPEEASGLYEEMMQYAQRKPCAPL